MPETVLEGQRRPWGPGTQSGGHRPHSLGGHRTILSHRQRERKIPEQHDRRKGTTPYPNIRKSRRSRQPRNYWQGTMPDVWIWASPQHFLRGTARRPGSRLARGGTLGRRDTPTYTLERRRERNPQDHYGNLLDLRIRPTRRNRMLLRRARRTPQRMDWDLPSRRTDDQEVPRQWKNSQLEVCT